ncbi:MAG: hypothetical protein WKG01_37990 [Kofleriaceae bacterium]
MRAWLVALLVVLAVRTARADEEDRVEQQTMRFIEKGDYLTISSNALAKLFDSKAYRALSSGFTSTVVIRIWIYPKDSAKPVAFVLVRRSVVYDVWDEAFDLQLDEPTGRKRVREKRQADALKRLTTIDQLPVALLSTVTVQQIHGLAMHVELNPVSKETLAEVRRWLSQGTGGGLDRGGAFFGSFVSVFVNPKIPAADRVLKVRSQPFYRPRP